MKEPKNPRILCQAALKGLCAFGNADGTCDKLFEFRKICFRGLQSEKRREILGE